jgi:hypothetical protein
MGRQSGPLASLEKGWLRVVHAAKFAAKPSHTNFIEILMTGDYRAGGRARATVRGMALRLSVQ